MYHFSPARRIECSKYQLKAYNALLSDSIHCTVVNTRGEEAVAVAAGIVTIAKLENILRLRVVVGVQNNESKHVFKGLLREMGGELLPNLVSVSTYRNWMWVRGRHVDLIVMLDAHKVEPSLFFKEIVPFLQIGNLRLLMFGDFTKSRFLTDLTTTTTYGCVFNVIC